VESVAGEASAHSQARRKKGQRPRKPVLAVEPAPGQIAFTVPEAAWVLRVSPNTIWNLLKAEKLQSLTVNRRRLIARAAIEKFIEGGGTAKDDAT